MKYSITKCVDGFIHHIVFTDSDGVREYSTVLPISTRVDKPKHPKKCFICGSPIRRNVCEKHRTDYHKVISELRYFSHHGYISVSANPDVRKKANATNQRLYGSDNVFSNKQIQQNIKQTNLKRYGVEIPSKSNIIKEKTKQTNLQRYGVVSTALDPNVKEKMKQTNLQRYGVENPLLNPEIRSKADQTMISKYGHKYSAQIPEIVQKIKQTNLQRYGVENPSQNEEIKKKKIETSNIHYGTDYPLQNNEYMEYRKLLNIMKYGYSSTLLIPEVKEKIKQTNLQRYGVENPSQNEEIKKKKIETSKIHYGTDYPLQSDLIKDKVRKAFSISLYGVPDIMEWKDDFIDIMKHHGISAALDAYPKISRQIALRHFVPDDMKTKGSVIQKDVQKQLEALTDIKFETNIRSIVPDNNFLEIDLLNRTNKISIEFNGLYWHKDSQQRDIDKANAMRDSGYQHIILDETDVWLDRINKVASMINPNKIHLYARQCKIEVINSKTAKSFNDSYHLQGHAGAPIRYGLFHNDVLVQIMTLGKPRYDKSHDYELVRLCTKHGYTITGGAEKLFKHFMKNHSNPSVISYSDFKYFSGDVYNRLGMNFVRLNPYGYVWFKDGIVLKRYQTMKHKQKNLL